MLQVKNIRKQYKTGELVQMALDDVSLTLRDNEFVAVLGPSGSGKTTLLNIIGGLDRYDSGNLIINNISTKKYKDRDWDSYRNHTIGFVFQSYNLIPHQSILSNVELALTISGISKSERRRRAKEALTNVGLGDQLHKRPNQMSGGQMQRVAIARALVNDPDILLADEPTGALDSETSLQVMDLLREVAKDRLVVMVTHNSELAEEYANRIIKLRDGKVIDDSNPYYIDKDKQEAIKHKNMGKSSMSFFTSLALSFNNLRTKKARTFLTAFAGSIGIIGIALILSLSNGVNSYITNIQKETMASYPITIAAQSMDLNSLINAGQEVDKNKDISHDMDAIYANSFNLEMASKATSSIKTNNLTSFKEYLDNPESDIHEYIGTNGIVYSYDIKFDVYNYDPDGTLVNTDGREFTPGYHARDGMMDTDSNPMESMGSAMYNFSHFQEILPGPADSLISQTVKDNYSMVQGNWPKSYDEVVLIMDSNNEIPSSTLYELGLLPAKKYKEILEKLSKGEEIEFQQEKISYDEIINSSFHLIPASDYYIKNDKNLYVNVSDDKTQVNKLLENSLELKIVGIARLNEDAKYSAITSSVGYTKALTDYLIDYANNSPVAKAQKANPDVNIINGMTFSPKSDEEKIADTIEHLRNLNISEKAAFSKELMGSNPETAQELENMEETQLAAMLDQYLDNPEDDMLLAIYEASISTGSYENNMSAFGVVSLDAPSSINIYVDSFEDKDSISMCIEEYNKTISQEDVITYTDLIGLLMSSITTIVNVISYVLVAFVAVSLVVSSIMIGIITFISVLERTKEIGVLRAIGASKQNIAQVFNAETFIIGFLAGLIGVGVTLLLLLPGNAIIHSLTGTTDVSASLPIGNAVVLIILSMALTLIAGLIPARKAAKKDPVIALRTE